MHASLPVCTLEAMNVVAYPLSAEVEQSVLEVAARSHLLLFGELHGTREVPALVAGLTAEARQSGVWRAGAGGAARPARRSARLGRRPDAIDRRRFMRSRLVTGAARSRCWSWSEPRAAQGLEMLCFDQTAEQPKQRWAERDRWMAYNLLDQWALDCVGQRVVALCGSMHARLGAGRRSRTASCARRSAAVSSSGRRWPAGYASSSQRWSSAPSTFASAAARTSTWVKRASNRPGRPDPRMAFRPRRPPTPWHSGCRGRPRRHFSLNPRRTRGNGPGCAAGCTAWSVRVDAG